MGRRAHMDLAVYVPTNAGAGCCASFGSSFLSRSFLLPFFFIGLLLRTALCRGNHESVPDRTKSSSQGKTTLNIQGVHDHVPTPEGHLSLSCCPSLEPSANGVRRVRVRVIGR